MSKKAKKNLLKFIAVALALVCLAATVQIVTGVYAVCQAKIYSERLYQTQQTYLSEIERSLQN